MGVVATVLPASVYVNELNGAMKSISGIKKDTDGLLSTRKEYVKFAFGAVQVVVGAVELQVPLSDTKRGEAKAAVMFRDSSVPSRAIRRLTVLLS